MSTPLQTVVLGASTHAWRYSHSAVLRLQQAGHPVVAIGKSVGVINGIPVEAGPQDVEDVHTITLYLRAELQHQYYDYIFGLNPKRIIFNPGAENNELLGLALQKGIDAFNACTLVLLSTNQF